MVTNETMTVTEISTSVFAIYFQVVTVKSFITIKWQEKKL